jgi:multiple sugar transport system permease protein
MSSSKETEKKKRRLRETAEGYFFISPWLLGFLIFTLGPLIASVVISFTDWELISGHARFIGFENYQDLLKEKRFLTSIQNTVYYCTFSVPLGIIAAFMLALLLNQKVRGIPVFRLAFYLPNVVSGIAVFILWKWLFDPTVGLLNYVLGKAGVPPLPWLTDPRTAMPSLIFMHMWSVGGAMLILLAGLQSVPDELYEAAETDGAGVLAKFIHITVPAMTPQLYFILVMGMISAMQVFTQMFVMTGGGPGGATETIVLYLYRQFFENGRGAYCCAIAWILFFIIFLITVINDQVKKRWVTFY